MRYSTYMSEASIYDFRDYREYLESRLSGHGPRSGLKKKAAEALEVHTTLISQILKGTTEISLELAEKMNTFLGHDDEEAQFFLLLVSRDRAGTVALKKRYDTQITAKRNARANLAKRVAHDSAISEEDQRRFYSSSLYATLHVLSSIPRLNKISDIGRVLGAPEAEVKSAIDFLAGLGVVVSKDGRITPGSRHVHLGRDSKFLVNHHLNWRLKSIDRIREHYDEDLHYSGAMSLSLDDVIKIKDLLAGSLAKATEIAVASKEETAYVLCFDFFNLTPYD